NREPRRVAANWERDPGPRASAPVAAPDTSATDIFAAAGGSVLNGSSGTGPSDPAPTLDPGASRSPSPARTPGSTLLVPSSRFKLQYAVDDAGPGGPASVEVWITQDGGRTWIRRGDDADRVSPVEIDLGGDGTFGICLVARSASGLGDQ